MRAITMMVLLLVSLDALCQNDYVNTNVTINRPSEVPTGMITGEIKTTDGKPAAFVTVYIKENIKTAITNEEGRFAIKNLKDGVYTLEITMVGIKPQQKVVEVKDGNATTISLVLSEDAHQLAEVVIETNQKKLSVSKINIADKDFPQSTGVVTTKVIADQQAIHLGEVVKNIPGVSLVQTRFGVNETYGARGYIIGVTGGAGGGSIFKNGLPTNRAGMPEAATLESVEVIKGSTAFLYGSSSGGLI
ncbi:MAG: beta-sandwich domain-containing protein, partial [Flavisolibacter sp.]